MCRLKVLPSSFVLSGNTETPNHLGYTYGQALLTGSQWDISSLKETQWFILYYENGSDLEKVTYKFQGLGEWLGGTMKKSVGGNG